MKKTSCYQQGMSLLEMMLVIAIISMVLLAVMARFTVWNSGYHWNKNVAQVQENVAELLAAASAKYYETCQSGVQVTPFSCTDLGLSASRCTNPWGTNTASDFSVEIVRSNAPTGFFYQIKVTGDFSGYLQNKGYLAQLLNADKYASGDSFTWTRLPSNSVINMGVSSRVPGNYMAVSNTHAIGGTHLDSGTWIMQGGFRAFVQSQMSQNQLVSGNKAACPD